MFEALPILRLSTPAVHANLCEQTKRPLFCLPEPSGEPYQLLRATRRIRKAVTTVEMGIVRIY